ncbi:uncharacterized protein MYCFIDRAFT_179094 [Pseudocercospora fijiensis CIRAD86]|uniref:Uncharacterized protein n=1 Tax=Pseudocercospora fijiensis (strain CIRAD86) TaxID=383855 RepID=M2YIH4_PSEFD|nr:uncharacterized protein MYCFIDRAFT_179094 [Pseudocercospora fijiensis CIRAD86]EME77575.1 hypothetical protein MYCFIDRAFT_179094 [Pseudocercospora fijiensis CIRAD86]
MCAGLRAGLEAGTDTYAQCPAIHSGARAHLTPIHPQQTSLIPQHLPQLRKSRLPVRWLESHSQSTPPKRTKKKKVVIQTPPHSPEFVYSPENGGRRLPAADSATRAPLPPPHTDSSTIEDSESESTSTADDSELERPAAANAGRNLGAMPPPGVEGTGATRAPYNPFARTLPPNEAGLAYSREKTEQLDGKGENKEQRRPVMDMDMFKNILMTGGPVPAGLSTQTRQHDSSSNATDTSSVFDSAYGLHPESPSMGYDDYRSASASEDDDDHEKSQLMGAGRSDDLAPPAPPKPKRGPQTVSFADFDQSIPPNFLSAGPSTQTQHITGILRTATPPKPHRDLNKPLPPPPQAASEPPPPAVPAKDIPSTQPATVPAPASEDLTPKKVPPPPPSSRRQPAGHSRARSVSNVSNNTLDSVTSAPGSEISGLQQKPEDIAIKPAPPPPPHRRNMFGSQPHANTPPRTASPLQTDNKLAPVPPPRRQGSKRGGSTDISRQTSDDSTTTRRTDPSPAAGGAIPPPPPPRRERGSKRTSLDGPPASLSRRLSGDHHRDTSFDSERPASISSLQKVAEIGESTEHAVSSPDSSRDILADMAAFQAEIDALRAEGTKAR